MTFLEAFKQKHPDYNDDLIIHFCVHTEFGEPWPIVCYARDMESNESVVCGSCWRREMPETKIEKENTNMENNVATTNTATTRKTKTQLLEEINTLKAEITKLDKYKQYEDMANEMYAIQQSFVNAGFTNDQAFKLMIEMVHTAGRTMGK